jgi:drug/metabolite transporter (DMT)-like permease
VDPTALGIGLALFSALTLASANLAVKLGTDILVARAVLSISAGALLIPAALVVPPPDAATWRALLVGVPAHFFYQLCLVRALQGGELSLVFPIMRGAAPLLTAAAAFLLLGEALPAHAIVGLMIATGAVLAFAVPPAGVRLRHHPDRAALGWAFATAVGVAMYNVADARGVRIAPNAFTYIVWIFLLDPIGITATAALARRGELRRAIRLLWRYGVLAGLLSIASYGAALYAFRIMETARVSALRETAVVFAAAMGAIVLKEGFGRRRVLAALALAAGLVLMQIGGN